MIAIRTLRLFCRDGGMAVSPLTRIYDAGG